MDERKQDAGERRQDDELKLPAQRVEDLEPDEEESADVKGGAWPKKYEGGS
ncbi:MAG: hypothetical protein WD844_01940 [Thermoleophilaceae bacterium]